MHTSSAARDDGFTLIEVIVAMLVFSIIMTGFLYTVTASLTSTRDTRARVVAANLASQQVDLARSAASVFDVVGSSHDKTLNGDTFHVRVSTQWVTTTGATASCEAGAAVAALAYKHIAVEVTWDNMSGSPVRSDTTLAPRSKINDPGLGTVLVGVVDAAGAGVSGVEVSLSPAAVASASTDSDGCAYLLKVPPGTYTVKATKSGYVSNANQSQPTATVVVTAGDASRASFAYDRATTFSLTYAPGTSSSVRIPTDLTTTFVSSYGEFQMSASTNSKTKSFPMFPVPSGYSILTGAYAETPENPSTSCLAPDPGQWAAAGGKVGLRPDPVAGLPSTTVNAGLPMGQVRLTNPGGTGTYLKAVYAAGGAGDPGCQAGMTYNFGSIIGAGSTDILLPYGTWKLYRGSSVAGATSQITSGISVVSDGAVAAGAVTLDPRVEE